MEFKILGPLEVRDSAGRPLRLPAGRERALLAVLLLRRGEVVSIDALVDALWGDSPPATAAKAIQGYVSHLRRAFEASADVSERVVVTQPPGYVMRVEGSQVDVAQFERLAAEARRALEDDALEEAVAGLDEALSLWRGPALAEFAFDDFAQHEIRRLEESRLEAVEDRIDALLRLGRHGGLVSELEALVAAHPLRARLRGQLMLALYRSGRQADALQVYSEGRRLLASELGLEPDPELQRVQQLILAQDPTLAAEASAPSSGRQQARPEKGTKEDGAAPSAARARRTRRLAVAGTLVVAGVIAAVAVMLTRDRTARPVTVVPPALAVVDAATNRVVASVTVGSRPAAVTATKGAVWVGDARDGTVTLVDAEHRTVTKTIGIGAPAIDLATGSDSVWVATGGFGDVVRIDTELGAVSDRIALGDPGDPVVPAVTSIGAGDGRVWAGAFDGLVRISPRTNEITKRVKLGQSAALQMAVGGGAVWATILASRAERVEARSAEVTAEFYAGNLVFPIALGGGWLWVGGGEATLWKVDPVTGATQWTSRVGAYPSSIAIGDGAVWVALPDKRAVARVDPRTGDVVATIPVGGSPEDITVYDGRVWVAVQTPRSS